MSDLIERHYVIDALELSLKNNYINVTKLLTFIKQLPSAEPERTAKVERQGICWEDIRHYKEGMCASCGRNVYDHAKYCDECGVRLDWSEE